MNQNIMNNHPHPERVEINHPQTKTFRQLIKSIVKAAWRPNLLEPPAVDKDLPNLSFLERSAEVLRYNLLQLEYALSAGGGLRAWLKLNLLITLVLAIPTVLIMPVITLILTTFHTWTELLILIMYNITLAVLGVFICAILMTLILLIIRIVVKWVL